MSRFCLSSLSSSKLGLSRNGHQEKPLWLHHNYSLERFIFWVPYSEMETSLRWPSCCQRILNPIFGPFSFFVPFSFLKKRPFAPKLYEFDALWTNLWNLYCLVFFWTEAHVCAELLCCRRILNPTFGPWVFLSFFPFFKKMRPFVSDHCSFDTLRI